MLMTIDRVFGHALNTVNKIRPGSQKPPSTDRLALYGLYKQSMEGDVSVVAERPTASTHPNMSADNLRKEQEKWDAWKSNSNLSRTEAKRRYIEKLIETMHAYASGTDEARDLVEELEFVWDQVKNNSQHSSSERSSPLQNLDRSGYIHAGSSQTGAVSSSAAAMEQSRGNGGGRPQLRVLSPVSQADEEEEEDLEDDGEEFVDARVSQVDIGERAVARESAQYDKRLPQLGEKRWRKSIESSLMKLTTEVAALREQLESRRFFANRQKHSVVGWLMRIGLWATKLVVADAVILWIVILYMRRRQDRRLELAVRVLLGDAVAQVQKVKMPALPRITGRKTTG